MFAWWFGICRIDLYTQASAATLVLCLNCRHLPSPSCEWVWKKGHDLLSLQRHVSVIYYFSEISRGYRESIVFFIDIIFTADHHRPPCLFRSNAGVILLTTSGLCKEILFANPTPSGIIRIIHPYEHQPYKVFDNEEINTWIESIQTPGIAFSANILKIHLGKQKIIPPKSFENSQLFPHLPSFGYKILIFSLYWASWHDKICK